jgi:hypothetical protein
MQSKKDDNQDEDNNSNRELHWGPALGAYPRQWSEFVVMSMPGSTKTHNPTMVEKLYNRRRGPRGKEVCDRR